MKSLKYTKKFYPWAILILSVVLGLLIFWRCCAALGIPEQAGVKFLITWVVVFVLVWIVYFALMPILTLMIQMIRKKKKS